MFLGKVGPVHQHLPLVGPSLGRCFHDWPSAAADDLCRVAFQARVTHFRAAWIVATELGPRPLGSKGSLANASLCPMSTFLWICWRLGNILRTGGGWGVLAAWADTNWRNQVGMADPGSAEQPSTPGIGSSLHWKPCASQLFRRHQDIFCEHFDRNLDSTTLPAGLQTLTFGDHFNQSLVGVTLPAGLRTLTFGYYFDQSLDGVTLPAGLQTLTFGYAFDQSLEWCCSASRAANLDFWRRVWPTFGRCDSSSRSANCDFWQLFCPKTGRCLGASTPQVVFEARQMQKGNTLLGWVLEYWFGWMRYGFCDAFHTDNASYETTWSAFVGYCAGLQYGPSHFWAETWLPLFAVIRPTIYLAVTYIFAN